MAPNSSYSKETTIPACGSTRAGTSTSCIFRRRSAGFTSEGVLETDERGHFVADAVIVEGEEQVGIQEQAIQHVDLHTHGAAERIERLAGKDDARVDRSAVQRVEFLRAEPLGVDHTPAEDVECERQPGVGADVCSQ